MNTPTTLSADPAQACRILVVDDDRDTAESFAMLCRLDGHDTKAVTDADAALRLARQFRPDVVVLDLKLRGSALDGFELARHFRADELLVEAALVAITGSSRSDDRERAEQLGFDYFYVKPADPEALLRLIDEVICQQRGRRASALRAAH